MHKHKPKNRFRHLRLVRLGGIVLIAAALGLYGWSWLRASGAATFAVPKEVESGVIAGKAAAMTSTGASGGSAVKFGAPAEAPCGNVTVPVGSRQVFLGDFSTGNFSQWGNVQTNGYNGSGSSFGGNSRATMMRGDCAGKNAVKWTVYPGDSMAGGERSEVASCGGACAHEGDERWFEWSIKFPNDFPNPRSDWFIIMQWHSSSGSPPLSVEVNNSGNITVQNNRLGIRKTVAPIVRGRYMNLVLHTKFSNNSSVGFVHMYVDGQEKLPKQSMRTMADGENYIKTGIYRGRPGANPVQTTYSTGVRITAP